MAKQYYNGVLLPEIPTEHLKTNPFVWIRDNNTSNVYDLIMTVEQCFYNGSDGIDKSSKLTTIYRYMISKDNYITATDWGTPTEYTDTYFGIGSDRTLLWTNNTIYQSSVGNTSLYMPKCAVYPDTNKKLNYNGVLLPPIPTEHFSTNPFVWIRKNETSGYYDLIMDTKQWYYNNNVLYPTASTTQYWYRIPIENSSNYSEWQFNNTNTSGYTLDSARTVFWSLQDISKDSANNSYLYYVSVPIDTSVYSKLEAETGILNGTAVIADRSSTSGNIVVDVITSSSGSLTMNFNVPKSDLYYLKIYFTFNGIRAFTVKQGDTSIQYTFFGNSYYDIEFDIIPIYLNTGNNTLIFSGGNTAYAPMFDSFEILYTQKYLSKYLICDVTTQKYYNIQDNLLTEIAITELTANNFKAYGNDDVPDGMLLIALQKPRVYYWQDSNDELPTISVNVTATPQPQVIITDKIYLTDKSITGIESALATCEGDLIVAVSFDDKQTWKAWNGEQWATLSDDNTGMSKETLEGITFEQWNELYTGATGFYVRVSLLDTTQSVEKIVFDFSN